MKKIILTTLVVFATLFTLLSAGKGESVIKIGVAGPHTGDLAPYGIATLEEAQRLAEEINSAGGIHGKNIEIIPADDICDPNQAANLASKLVDDGVVAVIGHICSGATEGALPTYVNANIPVISPSSTTPSLTKSGKYPVFFRTIAPDDAQGDAQVDFLVEKLGISSVAVIHDNQDYGKGLADSAKDALKSKNVSVLIYEGITAGAGDYSAVVSKIVSAGIDAVVFGGYHPEGSKLITQLRDRGYDKTFISGDGLKSVDFVKLAGDAAEKVYATGPQDVSGSSAYKEAIDGYKAKYGEEPGAFFNEGNSAFRVIEQALKSIPSSKEITASAVLDAIKGGNFTTLVGDISFNADGDANGVGYNVYQVENGNFVLR